VSHRSISLLVNDQFLEEDQKLIQKTAYDFAEQELAPKAAEWDENKHFPMDVYKKAADLGFAGIYVDEKWGGCGLGRLEATLIFEGLATGKEMLSNSCRLRWFISIY
jgi:alkylation response protein AidB-like acyl-CoA dehydrogenase